MSVFGRLLPVVTSRNRPRPADHGIHETKGEPQSVIQAFQNKEVPRFIGSAYFALPCRIEV